MQLDVLSVLQLPGAQSGPFVLKESSDVKESREQRRNSFACLPRCGFFTCGRQARYATGHAEGKGIQLALVKESAKPSSWVLEADENAQPGLVRVEQLRGTRPQPPLPPVPYEWPGDELLGLGLPPTFERDDLLPDGSVQAPGTASCHAVVVEALEPGAMGSGAGKRVMLVAHSFWRRSCPGKLVLAVARVGGADWQRQHQQGAAAGGGGGYGGTDGARLQWQWHVVMATADYEYVGPAVRHRATAGAPLPSPRLASPPVVAAVSMSWHPQGNALALSITDSSGRSCVAVMAAGSSDMLWHRRWEPDVGPTIPAGPSPCPPRGGGACAAAMAWVPRTSLLAVVDDGGNLALLDAQGSCRAAALLCGAIRYGESSLVRLGPILSKAAPLAGSTKGSVSDFPRLTRNTARSGSTGGGAGSGGGGDPRSQSGQRQGQEATGIAPSRYSLAFTQVDGSTGGSSGGPILAVCNGNAVALVRLHLEPSTPSDQGLGGNGGDLFGLSKSPPGAHITPTASGTPGDTPDRDAVAALPGVGPSLRLDMFEHASSFGSSAVSTPYMLGLQRVSNSITGLGGLVGAGGASTPQPLMSCRSNISDAYPPPAWPVAWRSVLSLPAPGTATVYAVTPATFGIGGGHYNHNYSQHAYQSYHYNHHQYNHYSSMPLMGAPSLGASSQAGRQEPSLANASCAYPSPVASAANMRYPSMIGVPPPDYAGVGGGPAGMPARGLITSADGIAPGGGSEAAGPGRGGGGAAGGVGGAHAQSSSGAAAAAAVVCGAPGALRALQQGDVMVLRGSMVEALNHYPKAHIYGFLPAFLALVHLHRIDAAARLLRAYAHFTSQVATAAAAAASSSASAGPGSGSGSGPGPNGNTAAAGANGSSSLAAAASLRQQWQVTMAAVLEGALTEAPMPSITGGMTTAADAPQLFGVGCGAGAPGLQVNAPRRTSTDAASRAAAVAAAAAVGPAVTDATSPSTIKLRLPMERFRDHHVAAAASVAVAAAGTVAAAAEVEAAGAQDGRSSGGQPNTNMLSVPEEAVLDVGTVATAGLMGTLELGGIPTEAAPVPFPQVIENAVSPTLPEAPLLGTAEAAAAAAAAAADEEELASPYASGGSPGSPPLGPAAALQAMLRVCLQLLLLACQAMAFVAFSAHGASRAAAAAAAVDMLALPMSPGSPRSPGGGMLSRQAMRRLSSTMRMRSLKTRSVSMFGQGGSALSGYGNAGFGGSPPGLGGVTAAAGNGGAGIHSAAAATAAAGPAAAPAGAGPPILRISSVNSNRGGSATSLANGGLPPAPGRASGSVTAGASITGAAASTTPTAAATLPVGSGPYGNATNSSAARPPPVPPVVIAFPIPVVWQPVPGHSLQQPLQRSQSGVPSTAPSGRFPPTSGAHSTLPTHFLSAGVSLDAGGSLAPSGVSSPAAPRPTPMRLQLHHCAFDATKLWQDASMQHVSLGQSAATVYLKPSYAAGLLLMAHTCTAQLQDLQFRSTAAAQQQQKEQQLKEQQQQQREQQATVALSRFASAASGEVPSPVRQHREHLLNGHASSQAAHVHQQLSGEQGKQPQLPPHPQRRGDMLRPSTGAARVNWSLLRAAAAATQAAVVWQHLNDWHRAALLAFACANSLTQLGAGSADLAVPGVQKRRRRSILVDLPSAAEDELALLGQSMDGTGPGGAADVGSGVLAAARAACLRMGQRVLLSQVGSCQKMEVQDACGVLLELVALPRRLLGLTSTVHVSLLQKVCTRVVDLLPKRVCITPLLPAGSVPPLVELSHAGVRAQLLAHCGAAVARVLEELRLAAACGGAFVSLRDTVQQISEHSTVDSTVRMLLRWQGAYDGSRVDATAARLPESVQDMVLLPDTSDWAAEAVLPPLQDALVASGLMSAPDAAAVVKAALAAAAAFDGGAPVSVPTAAGGTAPHMAALAEEAGGSVHGGNGPAGAPTMRGSGSGSEEREELQDLDELALVLDLSQLQHTLLAALQPFLHDALPGLRRLPPTMTGAMGGGGVPLSLLPSLGAVSGGTSPSGAPQSLSNVPSGLTVAAVSGSVAALDGGGGSLEDEQEDSLVDSMLEDPGVISALPPVELAAACLKLLLKLQWALHCRAQVCAHMLRLVKLQAPPPPPPALLLQPTAPAPTPTADGHQQLPRQSQPQPQVAHPDARGRAPSFTAVPLTVPASPRSFSHGPAGHRSFRDYIQHIASSGTAAAAAAAAAAAPGATSGGRRSDSAFASASQSQTGAPSPRVLPSPVQAQTRPSPFQALQDSTPHRASQGGADRPIAAAVGPGSAGTSAVLAALPMSPEADAAQCALMAWTAALVRADVFHSGSELQSCVLTVMTMVRSCPVDLAAALDRALRRRSLFNARLAEQVNRLKRGAPGPPSTHPLPPPPPAGAEAPAPTPTTAGGTSTAAYSPSMTAPSSPAPILLPPPMLSMPAARTGSLTMPGGALAPAPSLAAPSDVTLDSAVRQATSAGGSGAHSGLAGRVGGLQFPAARTGSFANPGPSPLGRIASAPHASAAEMEANAAEAVVGVAETSAGGEAGSADATVTPPAASALAMHHSADALPPIPQMQSAGSALLVGFGSGASMSMWAAPPGAQHPPPPISEEPQEQPAGAEGTAATAVEFAPHAAAQAHAHGHVHPPTAASSQQPHGLSFHPHHHPHHGGTGHGVARPFILPPSTPSTPYTPAPASLASDVAGRHPVQSAVLSAHADIRATSLKFMEYYADPSGALPSGLSSGDGTGAVAAGARPDGEGGDRTSAGSAAMGTVAGSGLGSSHKPPRAQHGPGRAGAPVSMFAASSPAGAPAHGQGRRTANGIAGGTYGVSTGSRSAAVSRATPHSTLLQCLVCELVRSAHSVAASVSWKATLEGGRGLAGCFVHPILHGGSSAARATIAAATSGGGAIVLGSRPGGATCGEEGAEGGQGTVSGLLPGAEAAQSLLLSLLDVTQWATVMRGPSAPASGMGAWRAAGAPAVLAAAAVGLGAGAGAGVLFPAGVGRKAPTDTGMAVRGVAGDFGGGIPLAPGTRLVQSLPVTPAGEGSSAAAGGCAAPPPPLAAAAHTPGTTAITAAISESFAAVMESTEAAAAQGDEVNGGSGGGGSSERLQRPSSSPSSPSGIVMMDRLSFSALTDHEGDGDSGYPIGAASVPDPTAPSAAAISKAAADRHGNSSMQRHNNPAFGLHSPTPSNLSEFWEETSELPSPQSTHHTRTSGGGGGGTRAASLAEGHAGAQGLLWRGSSGTILSDAAASSPRGSGTRAHSPDPSVGAPAPGSAFAPFSTGAATTGRGLASGPSPVVTGEGLASQEALAAAATRRTSIGLAGLGSSPPGASAAAAAAEEAEALARAGSGSGVLPTGDSGDASRSSTAVRSGSVTGEGEQMPTLSYLALPRTLEDMRRAVREAQSGADADAGEPMQHDGPDGGGDGGGGGRADARVLSGTATVVAVVGGRSGGRNSESYGGSSPLLSGEAGGSAGPVSDVSMKDMRGCLRAGTHGEGLLRQARVSDGGGSLAASGSVDGMGGGSGSIRHALGSPEFGNQASPFGPHNAHMPVRQSSGISHPPELSLTPLPRSDGSTSSVSTPPLMLLANGSNVYTSVGAAMGLRTGASVATAGAAALPPRSPLAQSQSLPREGGNDRTATGTGAAHLQLAQQMSPIGGPSDTARVLTTSRSHHAHFSQDHGTYSPNIGSATSSISLVASPHAGGSSAGGGVSGVGSTGGLSTLGAQARAHGRGPAAPASPAASGSDAPSSTADNPATPTTPATPLAPWDGSSPPSAATAAASHPRHLSLHQAALLHAHHAYTPSNDGSSIHLTDFLRAPSTGGADSSPGLASEFLNTPASGATTARSGAVTVYGGGGGGWGGGVWGGGEGGAGGETGAGSGMGPAVAAVRTQLGVSGAPVSPVATSTVASHGSPMPIRYPGAAKMQQPPPLMPQLPRAAWVQDATGATAAGAVERTLAGAEDGGVEAAVRQHVMKAAVNAAASDSAVLDRGAGHASSQERWAEAVPSNLAALAIGDPAEGSHASLPGPAPSPSPRKASSASALRVVSSPAVAAASAATALATGRAAAVTASRIPHPPLAGGSHHPASTGSSPPLPSSSKRRVSGPGGLPPSAASGASGSGCLYRNSRSNQPPSGGIPLALARARASLDVLNSKGGVSRDLSGGGGMNPLFNPPAAPGSPAGAGTSGGAGGSQAGRGGKPSAGRASSFNRGSPGNSRGVWH